MSEDALFMKVPLLRRIRVEISSRLAEWRSRIVLGKAIRSWPRVEFRFSRIEDRQTAQMWHRYRAGKVDA